MPPTLHCTPFPWPQYKCVYSMSLCLCQSLTLSHISGIFHHKLADVQFFIADAQFFAAGLLLSYKLCMFLLLDYFHPENYAFVLREAPRLSMCRHSNEGNPLTEHV